MIARLGLLMSVSCVLSFCNCSEAQRLWVNSPKKGVAYSLNESNHATNIPFLFEMDTHWFYSWGAEPLTGFDSLPPGIDFVPMAWGRGGLTDPPPNKIDMWIEGAQSGLYDSLLGFNEPDLTSQSNITVVEALELWPLLESTGLRLGSPAVAVNNGSWLSDFMLGADLLGLRVDFVAVHRYGGPNPQAFLDLLHELHTTYQRPLWITEFAVRDGNAQTPNDNQWSDNDVYEFMAAVLPVLEELEFVERYSWFPARRSNAFVTSSALHEEDGQLNRLGRLYKGDVQFINAGFEAADETGFGPRNWTAINGAMLTSQHAHSGLNSICLFPLLPNGQSLPGIVRQEFFPGKDFDLGTEYSLSAQIFHSSDDPLAGTREVTLRLQWFDDSGQLIGDLRKTVANAATPQDQWCLVKFENVHVPDLPQIKEVRASIFANNVGPDVIGSGVVYVDDLTLNQGSEAIISGILGDINRDGILNLLDVGPFVDLLSQLEYQLEADINEDGELNLLDVGLFVDLLSNG